MASYKRQDYDPNILPIKLADVAKELRSFTLYYLNETTGGNPGADDERYCDEILGEIVRIQGVVDHLKGELDRMEAARR